MPTCLDNELEDAGELVAASLSALALQRFQTIVKAAALPGL